MKIKSFKFNPKRLLLTCAISTLCMVNSAVADIQVGGQVAVEQRVFLEDSLFGGQTNSQASIAIAPQFETQLGDAYVTFTPFVRLDQRDEERTHADIRELMVSYYFDNWEVRAGIGRVFWGQTESLHLVDIINQTDFIESIDSEDKLGQPMLDVRYLLDSGAISFYILPYFRERTFPGIDGRLRAQLPLNNDFALYESEDEQNNVDFAVRWQQSIGDLDFGLAYFDGTNRLPDVTFAFGEDNLLAALAPQYNQLQQVSIDALYVMDSLLLKLEALRGKSLDNEFNAYVAGLEYTVVDFYETGYNLGLLMEHQYDEREGQAFIWGQNDLMVGARLQLNDFAGSEVLVGYVRDLDNSGTYSATIEGSTRLNQNWRLEINGYFFSSSVPQDPTYSIRRDDHISINIEYYF